MTDHDHDPDRGPVVHRPADAAPVMLTIHEWSGAGGALERVDVGEDAGALVVRVGGEGPVLLPIAALERVMERYGKPLAEGIALGGPRLDLGEGRALHHLRHLARYDVVARDFLVWTAPDREPLVELAVAVSGALVHLARAVGVPAERGAS